MLVLTHRDVVAAIDMPGAIAASRRALTLSAAGEAVVPVRHHIAVPGGVSLYMPAYVPGEAALGLKIGTLIADNPSRGLPSTPCVVVLVDPGSGRIAALLESTWLTQVKTGAGTAVATDALARSDCETYAVLGAGGIAYHQVTAVLAVRPALRRVLLWNRTAARAAALADRLRADGCAATIEVVSDARAAVAAADVVTAATASREPVVLGADVRPGTHVNLVGAHGADMREGDDALLRRVAVATVDRLDAARVRGDLAKAIASGARAEAGFVDIGAVLAGAAPGRRGADEITWYKSVGFAVHDLVLAAAVVAAANEKGLGFTVDLGETAAV